MRCLNKIFFCGTFVISLSLLSLQALASPLLTITPTDDTYHHVVIPIGGSLQIPYAVVNNTPVTLVNITATRLPAGVISSTCTTIARNGGGCMLTLTIPASVTSQPRTIQGRFEVCTISSAGCTLVDPAYQLDINIANTFLAITDIHLNTVQLAPIHYGEYTGIELWKSTQTELSQLITQKSPKFILWLGDLPAHNTTLPARRANIAAMLTGMSSLAITSNHMPVFYVYGNNDSLVEDFGAFYAAGANLFSLDPAHNTPATNRWPALNANLDCSVSAHAACTYTTTSPMPTQHANDMANAETEGYYSAYPLGSAIPLRLIVMNSVILSFKYKGPTQLAVAQREFYWLAAQLAAASLNGESVYIAMHIPVGTAASNSGKDMWNATLSLSNGRKFRDEFLALVAQYKAHIRVVMSGHTHYNEFRSLYADKTLTQLSALDVGVPGITPAYDNNPGMQVYLYDSSFDLTEAKTYYTSPSSGVWNSYSFQKSYACQKNSTMFSCVSAKILAELPFWKLAPQPIPFNPYETNYSVRNLAFDPTEGGLSSWLAILNTIQVVPIV